MYNKNFFTPEQDFLDVLKKRQKWIYISFFDIKQRYRRSMIGPFWITITISILVVFLGNLYAVLFNEPVAEHLPYVAGGFIAWSLISSLINESCDTFISSSNTMKQIKLPFFFYVFRLVFRNIIIFFHNSILFLVIFFFYKDLINIPFFISYFFAIIIYFISGIGVSLLLGIICLRFRDISQVVSNLTQFSFFLTPILWNINQLDEDLRWIINFNPFYHFIEIIRSPFLNNGFNFYSFGVCFSISISLFILSFIFFKKIQKNISYWI